MVDKKNKISISEKIANDFLLQFAYGVASSIVLLFIYNGSLFRYGGTIGSAMPKILWALFALAIAGGVGYICAWKKTNRSGFKIAAIYMFVTAAGFFWCVGLQQVAYYLKTFIPFLGYFANTKRLMEMLFMIIGMAIVVEIVVYWYRLRTIKRKRVKKI